MNIREELGKRMLCYDGGFGTALIKRGMQGGELSERWNLSHAEDVIAIHLEYLNAGSDMILANTFGAHKFHYPDPQEQEAVIRAGIANAKEAVKRSGKDAAVALDIGSCGQLLYPMGMLQFEDAVEMFGRMVQIGADAGADLIQIETMNDSYELKAAVLAAKEYSDLPVFATAVFDQSQHMLTGTTPEAVAAMLEGLGCDVIGVNCGVGPEVAYESVRRLAESTSLPVMAKPNAGVAQIINGETVYQVQPEDFAGEMGGIMALPGIAVVGGCCGTNAEHIAALALKAAGRIPTPPLSAEKTVMTCFTGDLVLGEEEVILGDRMDPQTDTDLADDLLEGDMDSLLELGEDQMDEDAQILVVNTAIEDADEADLLRQAVMELQGIYAIPLMIRTDDPAAMDAGLRIYNGKGALKISGSSAENIEQGLKAAKKYGAVLVIGTNAVSEQEIFAAADRIGLPRKNIITSPDKVFTSVML